MQAAANKGCQIILTAIYKVYSFSTFLSKNDYKKIKNINSANYVKYTGDLSCFYQIYNVIQAL